MQVDQLCRKTKQTGKTIVEFKAEKLLVRLIVTYKKEKTFEELLYSLACDKLTERADKTP